MEKINTHRQKVRLEDLANARKDGSKEAMSDVLTEAEKVQVAVLIEKAQTLQAQFNQVNQGLSGLITSIVTARGLDPKEFGVNLAAGRILPIDSPIPVNKE